MGSSCPICFDDLKDKLKASPDICDHVFCLFCLEKWSKLGSYCPVDRKRYKKIINLDYENIIQVKPLKRKRHRIFYDISSICEVCSKSDKPDILLLCDCCDLAFHCTCLSPPLETVPAGQWFCPTCVSVEERLKKSKGITKENDFGIFQYDIASESEPEKVSKTESSSFKASGNIFDTCSDLISVFEEIDTVNRNIQKDANASNSNVDIENENVLKSFNYTSEVSAKRKSFIKSYKTYNKDTKPKNSKLDVCSNQCINKEKCVGANLDPRKSLDSNVSCNSDLLNNEIGILYCDDNSKINDKNQKHNVGSSMNVNEHILNEPNIQNLKSNKKITRTKLSLNKKKSLIFGINECDNSDVIRKKVQNYYYKKFDDDCHRKLYENFSVSIKNAPVNSKESVYLDTSKSNLLPSCSSSFKKSDEGTCFDSFSNAFVKDPYNDATNVFRFDIEDASTKHEEKNYLSAFEHTEDIDTSQMKFPEIKPHASIPLYLKEKFNFPENKLSFVSHLCEICKLKSLKKYSMLKNEVCLSCAQLSNFSHKLYENKTFQLQLQYKRDSDIFSACPSSYPNLITKTDFNFSAYKKDTKSNSSLSDNFYNISLKRNLLCNEQHAFKINSSIKRRQCSLHRDIKKIAKNLKSSKFSCSSQIESPHSNFQKHPLKRININGIEKRQQALLHEFRNIHSVSS